VVFPDLGGRRVLEMWMPLFCRLYFLFRLVEIFSTTYQCYFCYDNSNGKTQCVDLLILPDVVINYNRLKRLLTSKYQGVISRR